MPVPWGVWLMGHGSCVAEGLPGESTGDFSRSRCHGKPVLIFVGLFFSIENSESIFLLGGEVCTELPSFLKTQLFNNE